MLELKSPKTIQHMRMQCRKKFLRIFKNGFRDEKYYYWERGYKWEAHKLWVEKLNRTEFERLLELQQHAEIVKRVLTIESRTNLLFSFEKMALRDAVKNEEGAELFAHGLYNRIYSKDGDDEQRFEKFALILSGLPRKQTRVLTWPLQTAFPFIANPRKDIFLKPSVTKTAAEKYAFDFYYASKPNWKTYKRLLDFAKQVKKDQADLKPRDMIDLQSFIFTIGWEGYG